MSEPDAVPLPREGEVFFDVRGEARSMRLSWYADSKVAVFSIWQGNRCTGTFRLPFVDLARMVQTLQSGPPVPAHQPPPRPAHGYPATVAVAYDSPPDGIHELGGQRYEYSAGTGRFPVGQDYGGGHGYGSGHDYGRGHDDYGPGHDYGHGHDAGQDYRAGSGFAATAAYGTDRPYGGDLCHPDDPYGAGDPYRPSEAFHPDERYRATEQYSQREPYRSLTHGEGQPAHHGYNPPSYEDLSPYRDQPAATAPAAQRPGDWLPPAAPAPPKRVADSESVPDTAMMSFPSVPARNGPSGYR